MILRPYQVDAVRETFSQWQKVRSTAIVMATALGKTIVFAHIAKQKWEETGKRILVIAHRKELIEQAKDKIGRATGLKCDIEMGDQFANMDMFSPNPVVIATVQSLNSGTPKRMERFDPSDFCLIICDEFHHGTADTYKRVFEHFKKNPALVIVGVTATIDRADGDSISQICESKAFEFDILDGVNEGWLVPVTQQFVPVSSLDLSHVHTNSDGDLKKEELKKIMEAEENVQGVCHPALEVLFGLEPKTLSKYPVPEWGAYLKSLNRTPRRSIVFTVSVAQAEACCNILNRVVDGLAEWVCGETPTMEREAALKRFEEGSTAVMVNCGVLTEGYDCLDAQTEILTPRGWVGIGGIRAGETMYGWNRETGCTEIVAVDRYVERPVQNGEKMFTIKSQHAEIRTTEGHQFHVLTKRSRNPVTVSGRELSNCRSEYSIPLSGELHDLPGIPLTDDELKFIAWFMTDGGFDGKGGVAISQAKPIYRKEIRELLGRLGLSFRSRMRHHTKGYASSRALPLEEFSIPKGTHSGTLKRNGWFRFAPYLDKNVSPLLHSMSREQFRIFWNELLKGDGSTQGGKSGWLWTGLKTNADAYTHMAIVRGFAASYAEQPSSTTGRIAYRISIRDKKWLTSYPKDKRAAKISLSEPTHGECVWCVSNRLSSLISRRNGKIAIIGNCPPVEVVFMARPTKSRSLYTQMVGRATRTLPGTVDGLETAQERKDAIGASPKCRCRIIDFVGNSGRHKLICAIDILSGKCSPEAVERAIKKVKEEGRPVTVLRVLSNAEMELESERKRRAEELRLAEEARKRRIVAKANFSSIDVDPFGYAKPMVPWQKGHKIDSGDTSKDGRRFSPAQMKLLQEAGVPAGSINYRQGQAIIAKIIIKPSPKQSAWLRRYKYSPEEFTRKQASALMDAWAKNGWQRPVEAEAEILGA